MTLTSTERTPRPVQYPSNQTSASDHTHKLSIQTHNPFLPCSHILLQKPTPRPTLPILPIASGLPLTPSLAILCLLPRHLLDALLERFRSRKVARFKHLLAVDYLRSHDYRRGRRVALSAAAPDGAPNTEGDDADGGERAGYHYGEDGNLLLGRHNFCWLRSGDGS